MSLAAKIGKMQLTRQSLMDGLQRAADLQFGTYVALFNNATAFDRIINTNSLHRNMIKYRYLELGMAHRQFLRRVARERC